METLPSSKRAPKWLLLIGLPIGFVSSLCGIGGGLFASSFLHFAMGMDLKRATGTGLVLVLATTSAATLTEVFQTGSTSAIHWGITGSMVLGIFVGSKLGYRISERVSERLLRALFAVVLLFSASKLLFDSDLSEVPSIGAYQAQSLHYLWALLIGFGGGLASPILGVGGGLVMVPGLFLGLPAFGFDAARACSLAGGVVGSSRSLWLKQKTARVSWRHGLLLGAGALLGASLGVLAMAIDESLVNYGRQGIGMLLVLVGLRFLREVLRTRSATARLP